MGNFGFGQIAIVVVLVVLLFGRGKISSLMGDVAKGIKSFKKGMATDIPDENEDPKNISENNQETKAKSLFNANKPNRQLKASRQTSELANNLTIDIDGNNNGVFFTQAGSGAKNLDLTIKNDNNSVSLQQHYGAHTATVELDGTEGTSLELWQSGGPSQTFNLMQFCVTSGGCTVSVIQQ